LERLRRAPYRVIFSSCDSGVLAPAGADELLGLAHTLAPLGTAGIVAAVVPVNDQATATLMVPLHRHLRDGATPAEALRRTRGGTGARAGAAGDRVVVHRPGRRLSRPGSGPLPGCRSTSCSPPRRPSPACVSWHIREDMYQAGRCLLCISASHTDGGHRGWL